MIYKLVVHISFKWQIEGDWKIDRAGLRRRLVRDRPRDLLCRPTAYFVYLFRIASYRPVVGHTYSCILYSTNLVGLSQFSSVIITIDSIIN